MLLHERTARNVANYIAQPTASILVQGKAGAGKSYVAQYLVDNVLPHANLHQRRELQVARDKLGIDAVRELQKHLVLHVPGRERIRRAVIIHDFDNFGHEAQNALLKTLEEPPEDAVIILTAQHIERVLPTIRSRTAQLDVLPVSESQALDIPGYSDAEIRQAFALSGGLAGLLHALLDGSQEHELRQAIAVAKELVAGSRVDRLGRIDAIVADKKLSPATILDALAKVLRASLQAQVAGNKQTAEIDRTRSRLAQVLDTQEQLRSGGHAKLVLTRLFFDL